MKVENKKNFGFEGRRKEKEGKKKEKALFMWVRSLNYSTYLIKES